jgi:hypothetical protein
MVRKPTAPAQTNPVAPVVQVVVMVAADLLVVAAVLAPQDKGIRVALTSALALVQAVVALVY